MCFKHALLTVLLLLLTACAVAENVTVIEHTWEYTAVIQNYAPRNEHQTCSEMPVDAYNVSRSSEERSRQVADGQSCYQECRNVDNGDGSTSRSCREVCTTKYRTESYTVEACDYQVDRWEVAREVQAEGSGLSIETPVFDLQPADSMGFGMEKVAEKRVVYQIKFERENGTIGECEFTNEADWQHFQDGQVLALKFDRFDMPNCATIKATE